MDPEWLSAIKNQCAKITNFLNEHYISRDLDFYICFTLCVVGTVGNLMNIFIYNHKKMTSPINVIFKALAMTDLSLCSLYLFDISLFHFIPHIFQNGSYQQLLYAYWITFFSRIVHFVLIWLTTSLAYWRYQAVAYPLENKNRCNSFSIKKTVIFIYIFSIVVYLPYFLFIEVTSSPEACRHPSIKDLSANECTYQVYAYLFWTYLAVLFSLSALVLIIMSIRLYCLVRKTKKSRRTLSMSKNGDKEAEINRINRMILIAIILYLVTDSLYLARLLTNTEFSVLSIFDLCFGNINFFSLFLFINPNINTLCYLVMSSQYRAVLMSVIKLNKTSMRESSTVLSELSVVSA